MSYQTRTDYLNTGRPRDEELLQRVPLGEQIKELVIDTIMSGDLRPGERIIAKTLAARLGVSQAPVREAIRDLILLGFLENVPYKGTSVRSFTTKELRDVYAVRSALESLAARLAAPRLTVTDAVALQDILNRMIEAARDHDIGQMVRQDNKFHETIIRISDNEMLSQVWQTVQFGTWTIVTARISSYDLEELARRHEALLSALQTRDPQTAMAAMQRHIEELGQWIEPS